MDLPLGRVLYQPGTTSRHVYFPNDSIVSLVAVADLSSGLEVGLVGRDGMVGIPLALGVSTSPVRALVQGAGSAMRMTSARFGRELKHNRPLQRALDRCAYVAMATAMQTAVCNKAHALEARLARWLLRRLSGPFQIETLYRFNRKFDPDWQPRYLAVEAPEALPQVALATLHAEGLLSLPWRLRGQGPVRRSPG